jgi:CxxC motif-containing protein
MVTEKDHVENMRARLARKKIELETAAREIQDMIDALSKVPRILAGSASVVRSPSSPVEVERVKTGAPVNKDLSKKVDDYIAEFAYDQGISIGDMIKTLKADHGVVGKDKSLYAYIASLLKKRLVEGKLKHTPGVGYYKTRGEDTNSILVHTA